MIMLMGRIVTVGKQGSGKTYSALKFIIDMKLKHKYIIITNVKSFTVFPDTIYCKSIYDIIEYILNLPAEHQTDYIIFFDEIFSVLEKSPDRQKKYTINQSPFVTELLIKAYSSIPFKSQYTNIINSLNNNYIKLKDDIDSNINNYINILNNNIQQYITNNTVDFDNKGTFGLPGIVLGSPTPASASIQNDLEFSETAFEHCKYAENIVKSYHIVEHNQKEILSFISQLRKRNIILVTTAQEWLEINITFRRYVRYQVDCNMISLPISKKAVVINRVNDGYNMVWDNLQNEYVAPRLKTIIRKGNKSIIDSYDTFETIETN